jgi:hypothetical protein
MGQKRAAKEGESRFARKIGGRDARDGSLAFTSLSR